MSRHSLREVTSPAFGERARQGRLVVLLPVGSVEPHGPHLSLLTDTEISLGAAERAATRLIGDGFDVVIAPPLPYGVTDCAEGFAGAISIPGEVLTAYLGAVVDGFLAQGALHVCVINNHLEPAQDQAVRAVAASRTPRQVSVACPLTRKWGRTLSAEFKSGACHAGRYETSLALSRDTALVVDDEARLALPEVPISLSDKLAAGVTRFVDMGLDAAYAGAPALASAAEGDDLYERLADMICGEVVGAVSGDSGAAPSQR